MWPWYVESINGSDLVVFRVCVTRSGAEP